MVQVECAFSRLDQKEDLVVEGKWKPITADRKIQAEKEAEAHSDAEGQLAEGNEEQGVEAG